MEARCPRGNTRRGRRSLRASGSWLGYLLIDLLNFTRLLITRILLSRGMIRDVTSQIAAGRLADGHPLSGDECRAMKYRNLGIHRRRRDVPRLKPKDRSTTERT